MKPIVALFLAAAPAAAQQSPMSFDAGRQLQPANGQWSYFSTGAGSIAMYGTLVQLRCDRMSKTITIARPDGSPGVLTIATDSIERTLPSSGRLLATDPLLDAIAFSRGRFLVSVGTGSPVAVPNWPEAARSIEDCRN